MSDFYGRMGNLATNKIKQYGKNIVLTQNVLDPVWVRVLNQTTRKYVWRNSSVTPPLEVTVDPTVSATFNGYGLQDRYKGIPIPGLTIQVGDIRLWAVSIPEPKVGDLITMNGKTKTVVSANPLQPGDTVLMWDLQLR